MINLFNKRVIVGVTGGIAAYKSAELVRLCRKQGAEVRVVMTTAAKEFITPLTMQALSGYPVHDQLIDLNAEAAMGHIELARWADIIIIAPATADAISGLVSGRANELLTALCLASSVIKVIAPAMNQGMWSNPATQDNIKTLQTFGYQFIGPAEGEQACGDIGLGRMSEPNEILDSVSQLLSTGSLSGKTVLVTSGPTHEAIDPVRYIANKSSGKMGSALALAALEAGAKVKIVFWACLH